MTTISKYTLEQINAISFAGFKYDMPQDTIDMINHLTEKIGSGIVIANNHFHKKEPPTVSTASFNDDSYTHMGAGSGSAAGKRRKNNKNMEVFEDWNTIRNFQATVIEQKTGINAHIDQIRLHLNKLTDKSFLDVREKIIASIDKILEIEPDTSVLCSSLGVAIYDIASSNKFYSKIYADLYAELISKYSWLRPVFDTSFSEVDELYKNIVYFDPDKDYDKFCDMNKKNDKRRANTQFFVNLALNGFISKSSVVNIFKTLLEIVLDLIQQPNKKNEVDELTENIAILFNKELIEYTDADKINGKSIIELITMLAKSKSKDFKSLSNKAIFKFMDLIEI
jgi:hypothetical protein